MGGLYLVASGDLKKGDTWANLPEHTILSVASSGKEFRSALAGFDQDVEACPEKYISSPCVNSRKEARLCLHVLRELKKGGSSQWRHYIDVLHANAAHATPSTLSHNQKLVLNATQKGSVHLAEFQYWRSYVDGFLGSKYAEHVFPVIPTEEDIAWARSVVLSHVFHGSEDEKMMVPMLDFAQHVNPRSNNIDAMLLPGSRRGLVTRDVKAGEQLVFSYGPLDNVALATRYGFVLESNPYGPTREISPLEAAEAVYKPCAWPVHEGKSLYRLQDDQPSSIPESMLLCEFLARLPSRRVAQMALTSAYRVLIKMESFPPLKCSGFFWKQCTISAKPGLSPQISIAMSDLKELVNTHGDVLKDAFKFCAYWVEKAEDNDTMAAMNELTTDGSMWSHMLAKSSRDDKALLRRCAESVRSRRSNLSLWLQQLGIGSNEETKGRFEF